MEKITLDEFLENLPQEIKETYDLYIKWDWKNECSKCHNTFLDEDEEYSYKGTILDYLDKSSYFRVQYGVYDGYRLCNFDCIKIDNYEIYLHYIVETYDEYYECETCYKNLHLPFPFI